MASSCCFLRAARSRPGCNSTPGLRWAGVACALLTLLARSGAVDAADPPTFFRGLNLNGPAVTIDGNRWEGQDSKQYLCRDKAFESQNVPLVPETDAERARMLRSSRWGGNRVELTDIPPGVYTVFLYVWEDNRSETFSVSVNGRQVLPRYQSGAPGHWERLGPWHTSPRDGRIVITSQGGAANFSGVEIWQGEYDGLADSFTAEDLAFFEQRIRPLLIDQCYECHSTTSDELQGDLLVDSRATLRRGGVNGPAVVPGDLERSLLIRAVRYQDAALQMPPDEKLSDTQIADLERWVRIGAPDPRSAATKHSGKQIDLAAAREFWSLRPVVDPPPPTVQNSAWPRNDVDRFILARLEAEHLQPAPDAEKRALLRRVTYDLIGLPPTPEEIDAFLADRSEDAYARVIDRLLDSPRYGERWGRHWLDVVRYADTAGDNSDYPIPQLHRYRDWVIEAFHRDLPYDEFVRDQLAGDLRGGRTDDERYARIIATGYIANARRFGSRVDDYPQHLTIEDTIDNLGRAFLGLSLSCTRCHDHKFDPLTTRDYYGLYGVFSSTRYPWPGIELDKRQRDLVPLVPSDRQSEMQQALAERTREESRLEREVKRLKDELKKAGEGDKAAVEGQLRDAEQRLHEHRASPPPCETAYAVAEAKSAADVAVQIKGDPNRLGDVVPRHFPVVLGGGELPAGYSASGRQELAEWILSAENPLPARVMANRIWQHHFGRGIVPTPNDFGRQGKPPTHPELLDYLAVRFREGGWSVKSLHRLILLSRTYQQSAQRSAESLVRDPSNELLSGFPRRRLDAESLRDTLLFLGGNLDLTRPGPHPFPEQHTWDFTQHKPFKAVYESQHRSVYLMTQRIQRHPFLAIFDGADPSTSTAVRMTSTTPLQALFLLNDPLVHEQSRRIAERIRTRSPDDPARIADAYELLLSRLPSADEVAQSRQFLKEAAGVARASGVAEAQLDAAAWEAHVRALLRLNEFIYLD